MTIAQTETIPAKTGRSLIEPALFDRLAARIAFEHGMDRPTAERIIDQALAFLGACATATTPLIPSKLVDIGWHTFVLYTQDYAAFCKRIAGRFIHHIPDEENPRECKPGSTTCAHDTGGEDNANGAHAALAVAESGAPWDTTAAIVAAGYVVDAPMWERASGTCSQCKDGCHNDPGPNPPPDPKTLI